MAAQVLVVEDERLVRETWVEALADAGYTAVGVENGRAALAWLQEQTPDLILTDLMMPEIDGFELLARVRNNPVWETIPVVVVSALGDALPFALDERDLAAMKLAAIVSKPARLATLFEAVRFALEPVPRRPAPPASALA